MFIDLTWENYLEWNQFIIKSNFVNNYFSFVQLAQWLTYDFEFKIHVTNDVVFIYYYENGKWKAFNPFYKKNPQQQEIINAIKNDLNLLNNCKSSSFEINYLCEQTINDLKFDDYQKQKLDVISNYIYNLEQLKTFAGNKMQKKRNHLNAFLKQNYNIKIIDIREVDINELTNFSNYLIKKYDEDVRVNEVLSYQKTLNDINKNQNFSGIVVYIDDKIVSFTLGFLNNDTYEIIIEKAERDIRGLFQFTIKSNLEINKINCQYIDRLDDLGLESLKKSKLSYQPIKTITRYNIELI